MGIATALGDIGLDADRATVLAVINLGVEGAQLAVILLAWALWSLARPAGYAVGSVAGAWLVARIGALGCALHAAPAARTSRFER